MPAVTRMGDSTSGICVFGLPCCPHSRSGTNSATSQNVFANGLGVHRQSDTGPCNCPHGGTFQTTGGSGTVFVNSKPVTRIGDSTVCMSCDGGGSHIAGSSDVFAG